MKVTETPFRVRMLAVPGLLAALCFAPPSSAQLSAVSHTYSGADCEPGTYTVSKSTVAQDGVIGAPAGSSFNGAYCPIIRTKPTYTRVDVVVYLMDMDAASEENSSTTVSCRISTRDQHDNTSSADASSNLTNARETMTGVFRHSPLTLSYIAGATAEQPFWTDIISTVAKWRRTHLVCDFTPQRTAIRSYLVTEIP